MSVVWRVPTEGLHPEFHTDVHNLLEFSPFTWYVVSGYRSMQEQAELYAKYQAGGPKAAPPGRSAHNFGLAVDVVLDADDAKAGLQPTWNTKLPGWVWLKTKCGLHPRLKSGWSFSDWPHVEATSWRSKRYPDPVIISVTPPDFTDVRGGSSSTAPSKP